MGAGEGAGIFVRAGDEDRVAAAVGARGVVQGQQVVAGGQRAPAEALPREAFTAVRAGLLFERDGVHSKREAPHLRTVLREIARAHPEGVVAIGIQGDTRDGIVTTVARVVGHV